MKVLLRSYKGEQYVWKKAEMKNTFQFTLEDGRDVNQTQIVSISRDNRKRFVMCSACGQILRNEPNVIKEHMERASTSATCLGCADLRESCIEQLSAKYILQEDGSYIANTKKSVKLSCGYRYGYIDIDSQDARNTCRYRSCATAEMRSINDFFTKYPGVFDDMITVDKILDNGFTERINYPSRGLVEYKLKGKNNITAVVNRLNIVDYFEISYRNYTIDVVYSKKYEMMFSISSGMYREFNWSQCIPDKTLKSIKEKIASLYN